MEFRYVINTLSYIYVYMVQKKNLGTRAEANDVTFFFFSRLSSYTAEIVCIFFALFCLLSENDKRVI